MTDCALQFMQGHCLQHPCVTISGMCRALREQLGVQASHATIRRGLTMLRLSRKRLSSKILGMPHPEQVQLFKERYSTVVRPDVLTVSIDECHFSERVLPTYGYSPKGVPCKLRSHDGMGGSWKSYTLIHAMSCQGDSHSEIVAGPVNRECFGEFVLALPYPPGTVLLLDNCSVHKGLDAVYEAKDYVPLFLSPYSPQFQPVELAFSKIKGDFRRCWPWPDGVPNAIRSAITSVTADDCKAFFKHTETCIGAAGAMANSTGTRGVF